MGDFENKKPSKVFGETFEQFTPSAKTVKILLGLMTMFICGACVMIRFTEDFSDRLRNLKLSGGELVDLARQISAYDTW